MWHGIIWRIKALLCYNGLYIGLGQAERMSKLRKFPRYESGNFRAVRVTAEQYKVSQVHICIHNLTHTERKKIYSIENILILKFLNYEISIFSLIDVQ